MTKKFKKLFLAASGISLTAVPLVAMSCGANNSDGSKTEQPVTPPTETPGKGTTTPVKIDAKLQAIIDNPFNWRLTKAFSQENNTTGGKDKNNFIGGDENRVGIEGAKLPDDLPGFTAEEITKFNTIQNPLGSPNENLRNPIALRNSIGLLLKKKADSNWSTTISFNGDKNKVPVSILNNGTLASSLSELTEDKDANNVATSIGVRKIEKFIFGVDGSNEADVKVFLNKVVAALALNGDQAFEAEIIKPALEKAKKFSKDATGSKADMGDLYPAVICYLSNYYNAGKRLWAAEKAAKITPVKKASLKSVLEINPFTWGARAFEVVGTKETFRGPENRVGLKSSQINFAIDGVDKAKTNTLNNVFRDPIALKNSIAHLFTIEKNWDTALSITVDGKVDNKFIPLSAATEANVATNPLLTPLIVDKDGKKVFDVRKIEKFIFGVDSSNTKDTLDFVKKVQQAIKNGTFEPAIVKPAEERARKFSDAVVGTNKVDKDSVHAAAYCYLSNFYNAAQLLTFAETKLA